MKNYISVNVVSQSLILVSIIQKSSCTSVSDIRQLKLPYGVNLDVALGFARQCEWIKETQGYIEFTQTGTQISEMFNGEIIHVELWKVILSCYISVCSPAWAKRIPYGRTEAFLFMNEEEQRCFIEAGLIDSEDESVLNWWDTIAGIERMKVNSSLEELGRMGERLTMEYEEGRTGVKPDWRSIETNLCGYDILSQRSADDGNKLLIEVKTSSKPIHEANAIVSRHEWNVARLNNNIKRYFFYFWCIQSKEAQLAVVSADEMEHHIPVDSEYGFWENASIPFEAFADRFKVVQGTYL